MKSVAFSHFPRIIVENGQKWLFNPVARKRFKNRPEERVRLKWTDFLLLETDWNKTRIGFEAPVRQHQSGRSLRADLILFSNQMKPHVLIECKSESVPLTTSAAEQAARYNTKTGAEFIILTNGVADYCFRMAGKVPEIAELPFHPPKSKKERGIDYWVERGFFSKKSETELDKWSIPFLKHLMEGEIRYLAFNETFLPVPMDHYYRIFSMNPDRKMAVSLLGFGKSDTYLVAVLNEKGTNRGVITINLHKMMAGETDSARYTGKKKDITMDANIHIPELFADSLPGQIKNLPKQLMKFFD